MLIFLFFCTYSNLENNAMVFCNTKSYFDFVLASSPFLITIIQSTVFGLPSVYLLHENSSSTMPIDNSHCEKQQQPESMLRKKI